ncbi:MAG: tripartite tricarboxylate transporter substrate binding protein [Bdellovibrionota bacterium]
MLKILKSTTICLLLSSALFAEEYPSKPIHIVVYTAPGGLMDVTARKIASIIQRDLVNVPVVVENKMGAGGIVAINYVSTRPADGHTILGLTSSVISKTIAAKQDSLLQKISFLALIAEDYEALITSKESNLTSIEDIKNHAQNAKRQQVWVGPASGGTDHIFALKVWKQLGITANWIPYRSGGEAIASLMGGHGLVYVGNASDVDGRPNLQIAAISAPHRLKKYPSTPTFEELGFSELTNESLWRGFAVHKDTETETTEKDHRAFKSNQSPEGKHLPNKHKF